MSTYLTQEVGTDQGLDINFRGISYVLFLISENQ